MEKGVTLSLVISAFIFGVCQRTVGATLSPRVDDASSNADPHPSASSIDSNSSQVFSQSAQVDEKRRSEPREFIVAGENVTVLGHIEGHARDTKQ